MEFYDDSPATKLFTSNAIVLSGGRKQDTVTRKWTFTERTLFINYDFDGKYISISVFDDPSRGYVLGPVYATSYQQAKAVLMNLESEYPTKVDMVDYLSLWETFFTAMAETVWIEANVTDSTGTCDQCGDLNIDTFAFLYVPAVPGSELSESSLCLHWEFGCFGGTKFTGTYEDTVDDVRSLLYQMKAEAKGNDKLAIKDALTALKTAS